MLTEGGGIAVNGIQRKLRMYDRIRVEHRAVREHILEYLETLDSTEKLLDSAKECVLESRRYLDNHKKMHRLAAMADAHMAEAGQLLLLEETIEQLGLGNKI